jgi:hypothetical protein
MNRAMPALVAAAAVVAVAGRGSSSGSTDKDQVSHVVVTWSRTVADGKGDVACRLMTMRAADPSIITIGRPRCTR